MLEKNVCVNPLYLTYHSNLKSACADLKSVKKKYGEDSAEFRSAFARCQYAESLFCNVEGIIKAQTPFEAKTKSECESILNGKQNEVKSWYA